MKQKGVHLCISFKQNTKYSVADPDSYLYKYKYFIESTNTNSEQ
jgi:hypothetical protein